ncbi:hypothetical protein CYY_010182 [Polysphondylium violaceum]|uniref:HAT C-terminal dimerisation domain-containing protein n=1 Tax=Polysphondylium violaceum TaxID=133409 RepID=A0A8J4PKG9_9MYCE|nr:hypothetical protein CYY_010182 [Polysphondylium violaceum]
MPSVLLPLLPQPLMPPPNIPLGDATSTARDSPSSATELDSDESFELDLYENSNLSEFQQYVLLVNCKVSPLKWWAVNATEYPILAKMARHFFGATPTEVSLERDFSFGSHLMNPRKAALLPETIRAHFLLRSYLNFIQDFNKIA